MLLESSDGFWLTVFQDLKIILVQAGNGVSLSIGHHNIDED